LSSKAIVDYLKMKKKYKEITNGYKEAINEIRKLNTSLDDKDTQIRQNRMEISRMQDQLDIQRIKITELTKTDAEMSFYRSSMQSIRSDEASNGL